MAEAHTVIVGGGIIGICAAYYLAKRGRRVTVLELGTIDTGCSTGNAGIIALGHPPIPRAGLVKQTIKWMFDSDSPLYIKPRLDLGLFKWMWQFRKACTDEHFTRSMDILSRLGHATGECFESIVTEESINCEYHNCGWYDVFKTDAGWVHGMHEVKLLEQHGFKIEVIDGDELRRRDPAFNEDVIGAAHHTESAYADPRRFIVELAGRAQKYGADIRTNANVFHVDVEDGKFRRIRLHSGLSIEGSEVIIAAGSWSPEFAKKLGLTLPMQPGKGYHLKLTRPDPRPTTACVLNERYVAVTPIEDGLRIAGTVEFSGMNHDLHARRLDIMLTAARQYLRGIDNTQVIARWCGLRPCTSDGLPVIGPVDHIPNAYIATGHAKMGLTLGPVTGKLLSEMICDGQPSIDVSALRVGRFRG